MRRDVDTKRFALIRYVTYSEIAVEYYDSTEEALNRADLSAGDVVAKVLDIKAVDPDQTKEGRS